MESKILEINLISAQGLKPPSANIRRMQTYALVWVGSSTKLRTRIDRVGCENPTWNDKFLFKVSQDFLSSETSGVDFEIYAVGCLRDTLIGTVRFLSSSLSLYSCSNATPATPAFIALQIRRPSGRCQGVLNIGAVVTEGSEFAALNGATAIGYRELMGDSFKRRWRPPRDLKRTVSVPVPVGEGLFTENSYDVDSGEFSDGGDSTTSSSSTASTALKDWNVIKDLAGNNHVRSQSDGGGLLCGLLMNRRLSLCFADQNLNVYGGSEKENQ